MVIKLWDIAHLLNSGNSNEGLKARQELGDLAERLPEVIEGDRAQQVFGHYYDCRIKPEDLFQYISKIYKGQYSEVIDELRTLNSQLREDLAA